MGNFGDFLKKYWFIIAAAVMLVVFLTYATGNKTLDVYTGSDRGDGGHVIEQTPETEKPFASQAYVNNEISLSMQIPDGWTYIKKDGFDTFVHGPSASSVQIQVISYYPMVNEATAESLYETYAQRGLELTEFERTSPTSYYVVYKGNGMDGVTDYVETVMWDRSHVAKIIVTFSDAYYERLQSQIWGCIDSMQWQKENPVVDGAVLHYSLYGDFEFAYPDGWNYEAVNDSFYAVSPDMNAFMTVTVTEDSTLISNFSQVDYTNYLAAGRQNFALTAFQSDDYSVYAEATYYSGDVQMSLMQNYVANGVYHYVVTYECPTEIGAEIMPFAGQALGMTRIFYEPTEEEIAAAVEDNSKAASGDAVFTPDGPISQIQSEIQEKGENLADAPSEAGTADVSDPAASQDGGSVSSFAAALVQVAGIPDGKAEEIAGIWSRLGMGSPTYAEAIKGNEESLILLITDSNGVNYYLYVTRGGDLMEIHMNAEDGPTLNF